MHKVIGLLVFHALLLGLYTLKAQSLRQESFDPPAEPLVVTAGRKTVILKIDGIPDEPDWLKAKPYNGFVQYEPET